MGRHKKSEGDGIFAVFEKTAAEQSPSAKIVQLGEPVAKPCVRCGRYPRLHEVNFIDKAAHPKPYYIDCGCGECDGIYYATKEEAVAAWNATNVGGVPREPGKEDMHDFIRKITEDVKIPD